MKFWEAIKAYQESGAWSLRKGDTVFRTPSGHISHYGHHNPQMILDADYGLEPQKIEVTREMLAKSWDETDDISHYMSKSNKSEVFKAFAESLGFK